MKIPAWKLGKELGKPTLEIVRIGLEVTTEAERSGSKGPIVWYEAAAAERIRQAILAPLTVSRRLMATALRPAHNPRWVFCKIDGLEGKHPVVIPRKLIGRMGRKTFEVEVIQDIKGTTYRHASLATGR